MSDNDVLRELGKSLAYDRPSAERREAVRSALLVRANEGADDAPRSRWWIAGGSFVVGVAAAAAVALFVARGDDGRIASSPIAATARIESSTSAELEHVIASDGGEVVRVHAGQVRVALSASATVRTADATVASGDGGTVDVAVRGDHLASVSVASGSATVTVDGQRAVFLSAGQTWTSTVEVADISPRGFDGRSGSPDQCVPGSSGSAGRCPRTPGDLGTAGTNGNADGTNDNANGANDNGNADGGTGATVGATGARIGTAGANDANASRIGATGNGTAGGANGAKGASGTAGTAAIDGPCGARGGSPDSPGCAASSSQRPGATPGGAQRAKRTTGDTTSAPAIATAPATDTKDEPSRTSEPAAATDDTTATTTTIAGKTSETAPQDPNAQRKPDTTPESAASPTERHFAAGWALLRANKPADAAREFGLAADASSTELAADARYFQATSLVKAGRKTEAERAYVQFIDAAPKSLRRGRAAVALARLISERGDTASAKRWYESALGDVDPSVVAAARAGIAAL